MAEMRVNRVKKKIDEGGVATVVTGLQLSSCDGIDYMGQFGFDGVWIEMEHGSTDFASLPDATRACDLWGMTSVVRVNDIHYGLIYRTLDLGAQAVVIPHVNTADEARTVVEAAKFHPIGLRGMYPSRQSFGCPDYFQKANDHTMIIALIEDIRAVKNLDEILEVDHIDVFFVAPSDLGQSMGNLDMLHPEVQKVEKEAHAKIIAAGRTSGALVNDDTVESWIDLGARFLLTNWTNWIEVGAREYLGKVSSASSSARKSL